MSDLLLLRADAGGVTGSGHIMRLVALGEAWIDAGGGCLLASAELPDALAARVSATPGFQIAPIAAPAWSAADAAALVELGRQYGAKAVAVDSYNADAGYLGALRAAGLTALYIDDVMRQPNYPCALLLNQNLNASEMAYHGRVDGVRLLLGTFFVLLRREFVDARARVRSIGATASRVLITFGGVDPKNASATAIAALALIPEIEADLIIGAANPRGDELAARAAPLANVTLVRDARDMAARIAAAEMILSAGGTTIWEAAALGCPMMLAASAKEEEVAAKRMTRDGGVYLGRVEELTARGLAASIRDFAGDLAARARSSVVGRALVDGQGAARAVEAIKEALGN